MSRPNDPTHLSGSAALRIQAPCTSEPEGEHKWGSTKYGAAWQGSRCLGWMDDVQNGYQQVPTCLAVGTSMEAGRSARMAI